MIEIARPGSWVPPAGLGVAASASMAGLGVAASARMAGLLPWTHGLLPHDATADAIAWEAVVRLVMTARAGLSIGGDGLILRHRDGLILRHRDGLILRHRGG